MIVTCWGPPTSLFSMGDVREQCNITAQTLQHELESIVIIYYQYHYRLHKSDISIVDGSCLAASPRTGFIAHNLLMKMKMLMMLQLFSNPTEMSILT